MEKYRHRISDIQAAHICLTANLLTIEPCRRANTAVSGNVHNDNSIKARLIGKNERDHSCDKEGKL